MRGVGIRRKEQFGEGWVHLPNLVIGLRMKGVNNSPICSFYSLLILRVKVKMTHYTKATFRCHLNRVLVPYCLRRTGESFLSPSSRRRQKNTPGVVVFPLISNTIGQVRRLCVGKACNATPHSNPNPELRD
jgi:hypothetical protein